MSRDTTRRFRAIRQFFRGDRCAMPQRRRSKLIGRVEALEARALLAADFEMLSDINPVSNIVQNPNNYATVGTTLFFTAESAGAGTELWKSNGTDNGTVMVKDIRPGGGSSDPKELVSLGGAVYFFANDGTNIYGLWKSDGTQSGTQFLKSFAEPPSQLTRVQGTLFFMTQGFSNGPQLWKSDGTAEGTVLVKKLISGEITGLVPTSPLVAVGDELFFGGESDTLGRELWRSNGTTAGTFVVADISAGSLNSSPSDLTSVGGQLFFAATERNILTQQNQSGLYVLGNFGTIQFPIRIGTFPERPDRLTAVGNTLFFTVEGELYKSDGTVAGTVKVKQINTSGPSGVGNLTNVGGTLYFVAESQQHGRELWKSDGTSGGTILVKDLIPGTDSSTPRFLYNGNGTLYFTTAADDRVWKSNGTAAGTLPIQGLFAVTSILNAEVFGHVGSVVYVTARSESDPSDRVLWRTDGTDSGTFEVKKIVTASSSPTELTNVNGVMYFSADNGIVGRELWKSNGSAEGTELVKDILTFGSSNPSNLTNVNGTLYFTAIGFGSGNELWKSDGTADGTVLVGDVRGGIAGSNPANLVNVNGKLYFTADDGTNGRELWTLGGRSGAFPIRVKDIRPGAIGSSPANLFNHNGQLYFTANDGTNGVELWKSDGTSAGTVMVRNIRSGAASSDPNALMNVNSTLYFVANDGSSGRELWKSDGTSAGTVLVKNIAAGSSSSLPESLTNVNGTLFFRAVDSASGAELWKSDGTSAGTVMVRDIVPGAVGSLPGGLTNVNGTLLFRAANSSGDVELWRSDGTAAGTALVRNISSTGSSVPSNMVYLAGFLYFQATGSTGAELWKSNGTLGGTTLVKDFLPGAQNGSPSSFALAGTHLFAVANTVASGRELFAKNLVEGTVGNDNFTFRFSAPDMPPTVTVLRTTARSATTLGIFSVEGTFRFDALGGTDTVRIEGSNADDVLAVESSAIFSGQTTFTVNNMELKLDGFETTTMVGRSGNDVYRINGDNPIFGLRLDESGGGVDTIDLSPTTSSVTLNLGVATIQNVTPKLSLQLTSASSFENATAGTASILIGNALNNVLTGSDSADTISGGGGNDTIHGRGGDDTLNGADGNDTINGGDGNDLLSGGNGLDVLNGDVGNDMLNGDAGGDTLSGGLGDDVYAFTDALTAEADTVIEQVNEGVDTLSFREVATTVTLQLGSTSVQSVHTNRTLVLNANNTFEGATGGSGDDNLTGNAINNVLNGGLGSDTLAGGQGDDTYVFETPVAAEADLVTEAANQGNDTLDFSALVIDVTLQLNITSVQTVHTNRTLKLNAGSTFENAIGGAGNDTLTGNASANVLVGNDGNDQLVGSNGRDILIGGNGFDKILGGSGEDLLIAGRSLYDSSVASLNSIMAEWNSANDYANRIINLRIGVGAPPVSLQATVNVLDDAGELDELTGGLDNDWYFRDLSDFITDLTGEVIDEI